MLPPYEAFHNKLRKENPLERKYLDYERLICGRLSTECAAVKIGLPQTPPTGAESYSHLQKVWEQEKIKPFKNFLRWYNSKDPVPTLEAMQKLVESYHNKGIVMFNLGCTLLKLANIFPHSSTSAKIYPFTEIDKELLSKVREMWL